MSEQPQIVWRIGGLTVERVRKFQARTSWEFRAPDGTPLDAIIFAGPNGCGKSSLLDAILFALSDPRSSLKAEELDERAEVQLELEAWEQRGGNYMRQIERRTLTAISAGHKQADKPLEKSPFSAQTDYLPAWRSTRQKGGVRPSIKTSTPSGPVERERLMAMKAQLVNHLARGMISRKPEALAASHSARRWLNQLTVFWRGFVASAYSQHALLDVDEVWVDGELAYDLFVFDGDTRIPVDHLSAGELEIVQLGGTLIMRPKGPPQFLLCDEPELHMHQAWQAAWLGIVRAVTPQTQLIIATHSEAIWQRAMSYERFLLIDEDDPRASLAARQRS